VAGTPVALGAPFAQLILCRRTGQAASAGGQARAR